MKYRSSKLHIFLFVIESSLSNVGQDAGTVRRSTDAF